MTTKKTAIIATKGAMLTDILEQENTAYIAEHTVNDLKDLVKASNFLKPDLIIAVDDFKQEERVNLYQDLINLKEANPKLEILLYMKEFKLTDNEAKIEAVGNLVDNKIYPKFEKDIYVEPSFNLEDVLFDLKDLNVKDEFLQKIYARYLDLKELKTAQKQKQEVVDLTKQKSVRNILFLGDAIILANLARVIAKDHHKRVAIIANANESEIFTLFNASLENKDEAIEKDIRTAAFRKFNDVSLAAYAKEENQLKIAQKFSKAFDYLFIFNSNKDSYDYVDKTIYASNYDAPSLRLALKYQAKNMIPNLYLFNNIPHGKLDIASQELLRGFGIENFLKIRKLVGFSAINNSFNGILDVDNTTNNSYAENMKQDLDLTYQNLVTEK